MFESNFIFSCFVSFFVFLFLSNNFFFITFFPGKLHEPLIELDNVSSRSSPMQKQTQQMLAQEQLDLRELEDKERDLLQLEVS